MHVLKLAPVLLVTACAVGPDYKQPAIALSPTFVGGETSPAGQIAARAWWQDYHDPMLNTLVSRGLSQNLDVKSAQERIREAEASLRETGVNAALDGSADLDRTRAGGNRTANAGTTSSSLSAAVVLDMFGGLRREQESARASLDAARADLEQTRLAWLAETIAAYADARYYQQALTLTRQTIRSREQTVAIIEDQFRAGAENEYDLTEARALLETARADLPDYTAQFNAQVFALATLLDEPAAPLLAQMQKGAAPLHSPGRVATGVPADLLRNRPDVRYYEALLHAAVADVGVATADMLPSVTLSGSVARASGAQTWAFGPALSLPVLDQGLLSAARDAKISAAKQAELTWRAAVNDAVEDVQAAQSNLTQYRIRQGALERAAKFYDDALGMGRNNYQAGLSSLLDLLDTDRSAASAKISAASAENEAAKEWATLQIATGAGAAIVK